MPSTYNQSTQGGYGIVASALRAALDEFLEKIGTVFAAKSDVPTKTSELENDSGFVTGSTSYSAGTGLSLSGTTLNHSNSVTAGTIGSSSATSGSSIAIPYATYDAQGHITGKGTHTHTVSGFATSDTKNTAGTTNTTSKIYLAGATSQAANPQTYSNASCYAQSGHLYSNGAQVVNLSGSQTLTNKSLTSPTLTGTPTAPTAAAGTSTTQVATTAFVMNAIQAWDEEVANGSY